MDGGGVWERAATKPKKALLRVTCSCKKRPNADRNQSWGGSLVAPSSLRLFRVLSGDKFHLGTPVAFVYRGKFSHTDVTSRSTKSTPTARARARRRRQRVDEDVQRTRRVSFDAAFMDFMGHHHRQQLSIIAFLNLIKNPSIHGMLYNE